MTRDAITFASWLLLASACYWHHAFHMTLVIALLIALIIKFTMMERGL